MAGSYTRWYRVGTVKTTLNSKSVVGTGTYWLTAGLNPGDLFTTTDGKNFLEILSIEDDTHLTLVNEYPYDGSTGIHYAICRNFTAHMPSQIAADTAKLVNDMARYWDEDMLTLQGESAYDIAKRLGKTTASEGAWINSLKGDSAYTVAVKNGYSGTEAQWLESLKGAGSIGTLSSLTTSAKSNLVAAVNEVNSTASTASTNATSAQSSIGTLSSLTTSAKGTVVAAINEVKSTATTASTNASSAQSSIGTLSSLTTTAKGTLVAAVNEVVTTNTSQADAITALQTLTTNTTIRNTTWAHRNIYRGKYLGTSFTAAQSAAIRAGTFEDLYIGDYWSINSHTYTIADIDYFYHAYQDWDYDNVKTHHLVLWTGNQTTPYREDGDCSGGYYNSDVRNTFIPNYIDTVLKVDFGAEHLFYHPDYFCNSVGTDGSEKGLKLVTDSCAEVASWRQCLPFLINGHFANIGPLLGRGNSATVWDIFALFRMRRNGHDRHHLKGWSYLRECTSQTNILYMNYNGGSWHSECTATPTKFYVTVY